MNSPARIFLVISDLLSVSSPDTTTAAAKTHRSRDQVREAALTYWRTESGTKIARTKPIHSTVYRMGFSSDHTCGTGTVPVLPKASRTACATDETGFHS